MLFEELSDQPDEPPAGKAEIRGTVHHERIEARQLAPKEVVSPKEAVITMDALKFDIQDDAPVGTRIKVIGVGGGGCDAAGRMYREGVPGVEFYAINTDRQALSACAIPNKLLIGQKVTGGLGAGADPNVGKDAALEDTERIIEILEGADMVFVAAGMGGGTGTGAAPVVASLAKEMNALTVAIVTKPFLFEGAKRMRVAEKGIEDLAATVDTLIQIPNDRLTTLMPKGTSLLDSFKATDDVLRQAVAGISEIMNTPGLINRDFADIRAIMQGMGYAIMGTASAKGEGAAMEAARKAILCPMLEGENIKGARGILINISASSQISLHDVHEACSLIREAAQNDEVQVNFGIVIDERLKDEVKVAVIATGFQKQARPEAQAQAQLQPQRVGYYQPPAMLNAPSLPFREREREREREPEPERERERERVFVPTAQTEIEYEREPEPEPVQTMSTAAGAGHPGNTLQDEPAKVQEEIDVPAFLRRDRRWFS